MKKLRTQLRNQLKLNGVNLSNEVGEVDLIYKRKHATGNPTSCKITCSRDAEQILRSSYTYGQIEHREFFRVLLLSKKNLVLGVVEISSGGLAGTVADPKMVFQSALLANASSIILCHNHPSGNKRPSEADIELTKKMKNAGQFLELPVLDHVILSHEENEFFSFADDGIL